MIKYDIWPKREDLSGLDELAYWVLEAESGSEARVGEAVRSIGMMLHENAVKLGLKLSLVQLLLFANRMGGEVLSPEIRGRLYPGGCWARGLDGVCPPFVRATGSDPAVLAPSETPEQQRAGMTNTFAIVIQNDPLFAKGGKALAAFQEASGELLPIMDILTADF
jgi:hypothetical protein